VLLSMLWKHSFEPFDGKRLDAQGAVPAHLDLLLPRHAEARGAP